MKTIGIAVTAALLMLALIAGTRANQSQPPEAADKGATTLMTAWGEPDLQGLWTAEFTTPLQRPARYADKEFFTDEERAELDRRRAEIISADERPKQGTEQDVAGAYGPAFSSHRRLGKRTSMIVDPPN